MSQTKHWWYSINNYAVHNTTQDMTVQQTKVRGGVIQYPVHLTKWWSLHQRLSRMSRSI